MKMKKADNLSGILTGVSIITGLATAVYAGFAGYKTKVILDELEGEDTIVKVKKIAPLWVPVVAGAAVTAGCCYGAHHEDTKKLVALSSAYAAGKVDKEKLLSYKEKVQEVLTDEQKKDVEEKVVKEDVNKVMNTLSIQPDQKIKIHDLETGYIFETTLNRFYTMVNRMNDKAEVNPVTMHEFYMALLQEDYNPARNFADIGFGYECEVSNFRPEFGSELGPNMEQVYTLEYEYANMHDGPKALADPWRSYN